MKKIHIYSTILLLLVSLFSYAQPSRGGGQRGPHGQRGEQSGQKPKILTELQFEQIIGDLEIELALNEEQKKSISTSFYDNLAAVKELTSGSERPNKSKMDSLRTQFHNNIKAVLTEEQYSKFESYMKSLK